eukprot:11970875-Ditylum_brightwellii.AAC.1
MAKVEEQRDKLEEEVSTLGDSVAELNTLDIKTQKILQKSEYNASKALQKLNNCCAYNASFRERKVAEISRIRK